MDKKTVLVTGIGGNVGQGILRNIAALERGVTIIGTDIAGMTPGNHLCDRTFKVPFSTDRAYLPALSGIAKKQRVDLIIPSTDLETDVLAKGLESLPCPVAVSDSTATETYLDKHLSHLHHEKHGIPFAKSVLPSAFKSQFKTCVVKPRKGRGSRDVHINPDDPSGFSDEGYVVQKFYSGPEITSAFYVDHSRRIHGMITMERTLEHGATQNCRVVKTYDAQVAAIAAAMNSSLHLQGSINIQAIVGPGRRVVPFEVNCRISGTNSIRSHFGFKDVLYTLQEHLWNEAPEPAAIKTGMAMRILMDVIYVGADREKQVLDGKIKPVIF